MSGPVFESVVDRALDHPQVAAAIGAAPMREWLRSQALQARDRLTGAAAHELDRYLALRAAAVARRRRRSRDDNRAESRLLPVFAVLVPSLGAAATGVFLLCGFGLRAFAVRPHIGDGLVMAGVIAAAVTAGAALGDLGWILATRARCRNGRDDDRAEADPGVRSARADWERALLERALVPFLLAHVDLQRADRGPAEGEPVGFERVVGAEERAQ
ncbi:hypothetical protein ACWDA7_22410 [Streptomyces sp. NPDC001156]